MSSKQSSPATTAASLATSGIAAWGSPISGPDAKHVDAGGHYAVTPASADDERWLPSDRPSELNGLQLAAESEQQCYK